MADDDGADAAETASSEGAELGQARGGGLLGVGFGFCFGLRNVRDFVAEGGGNFFMEGLIEGVGGILLGGCHRVGMCVCVCVCVFKLACQGRYLSVLLDLVRPKRRE